MTGAEYSYLQGVQVLDADGYAIDMASLIPTATTAVTVLMFLTHYADLSSWELAQQLVKALPTLRAQVRLFPAVCCLCGHALSVCLPRSVRIVVDVETHERPCAACFGF